MKAKKYELKLISDIFDIPSDKWEEFIVDLKSFYDYGQNLAGFGKIIEPDKTPSELLKGTNMTWIDDGKHELKKVTIEPRKD